MSFRKTLFWLHLVAGLVSGLSIGIMCFTGVALSFEKQLVAWSERDARVVAVPAGAARLSLDELALRVRQARPEARPTAIALSAEPSAAVAFQFGRDDAVHVDPYVGAVRTPQSTRVHEFMHVMEEWHRFLALGGDQRPTGKLINGICNLAFFVLAATGLYLWWPRTWSRRGLRAIALFNWKLAGKARDFNWHNVIGLWSAPILIVLTLTAVPISFRWGNALVYRLVSETPPVQAGPGQGAPAAVSVPPPPPGAKPLGRDALLAAVQNEFPQWQLITLRLAAGGRGAASASSRANAAAPASDAPSRVAGSEAAREPRSPGGAERERSQEAPPVTFTVKMPGSWPRTATTTVTVDPFTGDILRRDTFADQSAGRQLRSWTRFLHTGEALGWGGQLLAGAASLGGCFLVYTGFALSWRRFFSKKPPQSEPRNA